MTNKPIRFVPGVWVVFLVCGEAVMKKQTHTLELHYKSKRDELRDELGYSSLTEFEAELLN